VLKNTSEFSKVAIHNLDQTKRGQGGDEGTPIQLRSMEGITEKQSETGRSEVYDPVSSSLEKEGNVGLKIEQYNSSKDISRKEEQLKPLGVSSFATKKQLSGKESKISKLNLKLTNLSKKNSDFQDEFLSNYDNFSVSWREAIEKEKRF